MRNINKQHLRCSELELRGPKDSLFFCPRSSRGVRSALLLAQMPNLLAEWAGWRAGGASRG
eukprot:10872864-Alexandrium_andersonii.AAC.1